MNLSPLSRRVVVAAPLALLTPRLRSAHAAVEPVAPFKAGAQAWTFNHYTVLEAIEKTAQAGGKYIEFYPGQALSPDRHDTKFDHNSPDDALQTVKAQLAKFGVMATAYGVVGLGKNESENRRVFDFARKMGLQNITTEPDASALDDIEKLVKEYDVRVAIHNHPKRANDPNYKYWNPEYVAGLMKGRDKRMGSCADTGHFVRSGLKPVDALRTLKGRVLGSHLKDLNEFTPGGHDVPYGTGVSDVSAVLTELRAQKFDGPISVEYEYNWDASVPDVAQCLGFVRGWENRTR